MSKPTFRGSFGQAIRKSIVKSSGGKERDEEVLLAEVEHLKFLLPQLRCFLECSMLKIQTGTVADVYKKVEPSKIF